mgnify:FL=1
MDDKKIILFDLDGTLIDTAPDMYQALILLLREQDKTDVPYEDVRSQVSNGVLGVFSVAFNDDPKIEGERYKRYLDLYDSISGKSSALFNNVNELLDNLDSKDIYYGVVTNKSSRFAIPLLKKYKLYERLLTLVCGDEVREKKPHPEPLFKAIEKTKFAYKRDNIFYVGDARKDIIAAKAANFKSIACSYGYREDSDDPKLWSSDYLIDDLMEISEIV